MDTLVIKLTLTPLIVAAATLAGRRWGQLIGGWLVALPLTSGPIALFLALEHGTGFAAAAAVGALAGTIAQAAFCVAYRAAAARGALPALLAGSAGFAAAAFLLAQLALSPLAWFLATLVVLGVAVAAMPRRGGTAARVAPPPWDLPSRVVVATALVLVLTGAAPALGALLAGLLATFPLYAAVLAVFAHAAYGPAPAVEALRGLLLGLAGFAGFFLVLALVIDWAGILPAFAAALAAALVIQTGVLLGVRAGR